jgi:hypothetical protein
MGLTVGMSSDETDDVSIMSTSVAVSDLATASSEPIDELAVIGWTSAEGKIVGGNSAIGRLTGDMEGKGMRAGASSAAEI